MTETQICKSIGKSKNWLAAIKKQNPNFYRQMKFLGKGNILKGYYILEAKKRVLQCKVEELYYTDKEFIKNLVRTDEFKYYESAWGWVDKILKSQNISYSTVHKIRKRLRLVKKLKHKNNVIYHKSLKTA